MIKNEANTEKLIDYDKLKKGILTTKRRLSLTDYHLLAECIYSAKFLAEGQTKRLVDMVCGFAGEEQAKTIRCDAYLTDRAVKDNRDVLLNVASITEAMSEALEGQRHTPEKISFEYLKSAINEMFSQVEQSQKSRVIVSPFQLMIHDGHYYLLAFDHESRQMRTYRVDRMKDIERTGAAREGEDIFRRIDLQKYASRVFSMGSGRTESVKLQFSDQLMDAALEHFGTSGVNYAKADDSHFTVTANVDISDRFFGWLLGFGKRVTILEPASVVSEFTAYLDSIRELYASQKTPADNA